jgi:hypothetical protein
MQIATTVLTPFQPAPLATPVTLFGEPTLVGLRVEVPTGKCCDGAVAEIHPGRGPHVYELRCSSCGGHRGWLSRSAAAWLRDLIARYGWPSRPIRIVSQQEDRMSKFELKPGYGQLFKNTDKSKDTDRDYKGEANIEGFGPVWISGWKKTTKNGDPFLSLSIKVKETKPKAGPGGARPSTRDELNDEIPW